jgi:hypothetical protein
LESAAALLGEAFELAREVGDKGCIVLCLAGLGGVAAAKGEPEHAAGLLGAAEALGDSIGGLLHPVNEREFQHWVSDVRAELGEEKFAELRAEGLKMDFQQAVGYALKSRLILG